ncbi:unnamed protein product [Rhodiola kirilowii]
MQMWKIKTLIICKSVFLHSQLVSVFRERRRISDLPPN